MKRRFSSLGLIMILSLGYFGIACVTKAPPKVLTLSEQLEVDTKRAQSLSREFSRQITFKNAPRAEKFLNAMAKGIAGHQPGFEGETVRVKIHEDFKPEQRHFFSFPGTLISIPSSFITQVQFENELAAAISFELANVLNRFLATKVEAGEEDTPQLFGPGNVFELSNIDRASSIRLGTRLLYLSGYDPRGMPSIFHRYPDYYVSSASGLFKKQVDFNVREAQRAKSEFLPSLKPVVRSGEFIQFLKELHKNE